MRAHDGDMFDVDDGDEDEDMRGRGDRFRAYVGNECVYWTDSEKGMRDQCARLLEWRYAGERIVVADTLRVDWVRSVDADSIVDWRV